MTTETLKNGFECRPFSRQKRLWCVEFNNHSVIHECNLVKIKDRIELVCNSHDGLVLKVRANNLLHELIRLRVDTRKVTVNVLSTEDLENGKSLLTYLLVASSIMRTLLDLHRARPRQNNCCCPWESRSSVISASNPPLDSR